MSEFELGCSVLTERVRQGWPANSAPEQIETFVVGRWTVDQKQREWGNQVADPLEPLVPASRLNCSGPSCRSGRPGALYPTSNLLTSIVEHQTSVLAMRNRDIRQFTKNAELQTVQPLCKTHHRLAKKTVAGEVPGPAINLDHGTATGSNSVTGSKCGRT